MPASKISKSQSKSVSKTKGFDLSNYDLIITEKPSAAKRIANALGSSSRLNISGVVTYKIEHNSKQLIVVPAVGHLYTIAEKNKSFSYPVFEVEWKPIFDVNKKASYARKYWKAISEISKKANEVIIACDYDVEGEVIGFNALRFIAKRKDASRMKFSTLTKNELLKSYKNRSKTINWGQALAGETRHILDWFYGINLSRALMTASKSIGKFATYSIGRVQGPALKLVVDRELSIKAFKPIPYWIVSLILEYNQKQFQAFHVRERFLDKESAFKVFKTVKDSKPFVKELIIDNILVPQPTAFDLTTLQIEAYKWLRLSPSQSLAIAQDLYLQGLISYPRTSSQQLPQSIGYKKILKALDNIGFGEFLKYAVSKQPRQGKKTDPAHPAIFPTGLEPKNISGKHLKLYELIVKRFIACFCQPAKKQIIKVVVNANNELFKAEGVTIVDKAWMNVYPSGIKEQELPGLSKGNRLKLIKALLDEKETQPPKRYTQASLVKQLEKHGLGTKATRAQVVATLYDRGYIIDDPIKATELGIKTVEVLQKYAPKILDEALTRHFEQELESITNNSKQKQQVLEEAKKVLINILERFKIKEKAVGEQLSEAKAIHERNMTTIGKCPNCKKGMLRIIRSKKTKKRFIACDNYPNCKTIYPLPQTGIIKPTKKVCNLCGSPIIKIIRKARKPLEICVNPNCESRKIDENVKKVIDDINQGVIKKKCPKCGADLVVRKSIYGVFLACSRYPKCKYTETINAQNKKILKPEAKEYGREKKNRNRA